jgi:hypothetical protein
MKITDSAALNFHRIFIPLNQLFRAILDFGFWIADLLYRFALSFFIKLIRRLPARRVQSLQLGERRTLNPNSKIQNPKFMRNKSGITF